MCVQERCNRKNFSNSSSIRCRFKDSRISQSDEQFRVRPHADVRFAAYNASLLGTDTCSVTWTVAARNYSRKFHHRFDGTDVGSTSSENLSRRRRITVSWIACTARHTHRECNGMCQWPLFLAIILVTCIKLQILFNSGSMDYGIFQMNANVDRRDVKSNRFLNLTLSGHQTLHHLFPTLDMNLLPQLYELFEDTCAEFGIRRRQLSCWESTVGCFQQLARTSGRSIKSMRLWIDNYILEAWWFCLCLFVEDYSECNARKASHSIPL